MRASEFIGEHRLVFKRNPITNKLSLKWRCTTGPRKDKTVASVKQCSAAPNLKKISKMKLTRKKTRVRQARKTKKTKRINPMAKLAARLNKLRKK
jgi:hypothetical protein